MDFLYCARIISSIIASALLGVGYFSYFKDIFLKKTKPHLYTWLVWGITQGTATVALWHGGGGLGVVSLSVGTFLVCMIFLLSFKYGTKNITRFDTFVLISALLAIFVWWQMDNPLLAVFMVSVIDGLGYIPTFRKTFANPWSETTFFWATMIFVDILAMFSNSQYNFLTMTYLTTLMVLNFVVLMICVYRRKVVLEKFDR